jgi:hypothetical protein
MDATFIYHDGENKGISEFYMNCTHRINIEEKKGGNNLEGNNINSLEPIYDKKLNPWFSIWLQPRRTMRQILDKTYHGHVIELAAVGGIPGALGRAGDGGVSDSSLFVILLFAIIGGLLGGLISLYLWSGLVKWTGKWIGGKATYDEIIAASAWSNVPAIWTLILWSLYILLFGKSIFIHQTLITFGNLTLSGVSWIFNAIIFIVGVWSIFINIKCIAETQGFSAWLALANYIIAALVILTPMIILMVINYIAFI